MSILFIMSKISVRHPYEPSDISNILLILSKNIGVYIPEVRRHLKHHVHHV